jgi:hypothetical protein
VHYVLANDTHVPVLFACSLESVLRTVDNRSRVNVFVVFGIEFERPVLDKQRPVSGCARASIRFFPVAFAAALVKIGTAFSSDYFT